MRSSAKNVKLTSVDDLFSTEESRANEQREKVMEIPLSELHPFKDHPFKVLDDDRMLDTVESVKQYGVLSPALARPHPQGGYELVSGHRRHRAAELAGLNTLPTIVRNLDDDEATILMVDSNLQRETVLPSERAWASPKEKPKSIENRKRLGVSLYGNGWPGPRVRWCTGQLKTHLINKEVNRLKKERNALHYVGIAADETERCKDEKYPLVDWGIVESSALQHCYERGFRIGNLYEIYHRASCWCCPLQRIGELRKLRRHHPELWKRLMDMDRRAIEQFGNNPLGQFKENWTVAQLDHRFACEDAMFGGGG